VNSISVYAHEGQPIVVEGLVRTLERSENIVFFGASADPADSIEAVRRLQPGVVLISTQDGFPIALDLIERVQAISGLCYPVLWTHRPAEAEAFRALKAGARGILGKSLPVAQIVECVRAVAQGRVWAEHSTPGPLGGFLRLGQTIYLTPREREIVMLLSRGMKNRQIAETLCITIGTVKVHLMHAFEKTGAKNRLELALRAQELLESHPA